ncbi:MAG: lytic murein transglycosylase B [Porticoccaceae bacterium]|jgi:membrane-bound lytic murein transglycosylase B|nr:lytic murein transglycosylase B [Porticoccaceae bacterium]MEA3300733.1 lytic murein transglycosylase B [Pseudomonadota bacterium]HLS98652.1 lytic murein transglycosylase B [Porticoccaceae bacterium]
MRKGFLMSLVCLAASVSSGCLADESYQEHPQARQLVERMVADHDFDREALLDLFAKVEKKQSIIDAMERPAERVKPWHEYRKIFIQEQRISQGVEFWRHNADDLARAQREYGVDPAIIVAIIGVETSYGRITGSYRVMDALATLAFDYPKRSPFFTKELENFLLLTREQGKDPLSLKGSYAGAMGYGQFMPSSYRNYAVDFDGDRKIDIWNNTSDAIGSVANYFVRHGWRSNQPVAIRATARAGYTEAGLNELKVPDATLDDLRQRGFAPAAGGLDADVAAVPLRLELENGEEFWLGFDNFYVITRYNHSYRYAMAVYQLSELIRERMGREAS